MVWALSVAPNPAADEILHDVAVPHTLIKRWVDPGDHANEPFAIAKDQGAVTLTPSQAEAAGLGSIGHVLIVAITTGGAGPRWWWLVLGRRDSAFTSEERSVAMLVLRQWEAAYHQPPAPMVGRVLLGADRRLIHADANTRILFIQHPDLFEHLVDTLQSVSAQRWGEVPAGVPLDLAVRLENKLWWVRFHRVKLATSREPGRWHLELYHLDADELPVIGTIEDERIARAVGFIHAHYHRAPSLAEIARAVHVSPYHFHRLFTRTVGVSPKHYLQRKQIQVARWLLRSTRQPVGQIAKATGFSSHGHFTSTFHRVVGDSPSDFREKAG